MVLASLDLVSMSVINMLGQANYQEDIQDSISLPLLCCHMTAMISIFSLKVMALLQLLSEVENPEATLFDTYIFKLNQQQIIDLMKSHY